MSSATTNHGLSVLTNSSKRLQRPVAKDTGAVSGCFNDATSGQLYGHSSGHEGIDFSCVEGSVVRAMYGGKVVEKNDTWISDDGIEGVSAYGRYVKIQSYMDPEPGNPESGPGFEHVYAHLSEVKRMGDDKAEISDAGLTASHADVVDISINDVVAKGALIGFSGNTGAGTGAHLHVHVRPFDSPDRITRDNNPPDCRPDLTRETVVADRIGGCMNFACFLPADLSVPPITENGELLSPRDSDASSIPVYRNHSVDPSPLGSIDGSKIVYYTVKDTREIQGITWYQIQYSSGTNGLGWVPNIGQVNNLRVVWVQVEDYRLTTLAALPLPPQ